MSAGENEEKAKQEVTVSEATKKRGWFRGRVWLIAIVACMFLISLFGIVSLIRSHLENAATQRLQARGVKIDWTNTAPPFLKRILGADLLESFRSAYRINAENKELTDADLFAIDDMSQLSDLNLEGTKITNGGLRRLQGLPNLRELNLAKTNITDEGLEHLRRLPVLDHLILSETRITGRGLIHAVELTKLRQVNLDRSDLSNEGLNQIFQLPELDMLVVNSTGMAEQITDQGLTEISQAKNLRSITLSGTSITDAGIKNLESMMKLSGLGLSRTKITDIALQSLGKLENLTVLNLNETIVGGAGLKSIANLTKMVNLWLARTRVTHTDLIYLQNMKLHSLWLHGTDVTLSDLKVLSGMTTLKILSIGRCETLSDADVRILSSFPQLHGVYLGDLPITSEILRKLSQIPQLEYVVTTRKPLLLSEDELKEFNDKSNFSVETSSEEEFTP